MGIGNYVPSSEIRRVLDEESRPRIFLGSDQHNPWGKPLAPIRNGRCGCRLWRRTPRVGGTRSVGRTLGWRWCRDRGGRRYRRGSGQRGWSRDGSGGKYRRNRSANFFLNPRFDSRIDVWSGGRFRARAGQTHKDDDGYYVCDPVHIQASRCEAASLCCLLQIQK